MPVVGSPSTQSRVIEQRSYEPDETAGTTNTTQLPVALNCRQRKVKATSCQQTYLPWCQQPVTLI